MSKKEYDTKDTAKFLANVIKHNLDLFQSDDRFEDAVVMLEVRLVEAYNAGKNGMPAVESLFTAKGIDIDLNKLVTTTKNN